MTNALEDLLRRGPEADDERVRFQTGKIGVVGRQSTASRDNGSVASRQLRDDPALPVAENRFPVLLENVFYAGAGTRFDNRVRVEECEMQLVRDEASNGGFTRAHKANQGEIAQLTGIIHSNLLLHF